MNPQGHSTTTELSNVEAIRIGSLGDGAPESIFEPDNSGLQAQPPSSIGECAEPDLAQAQQFLDLLEPNGHFVFQTFGESASRNPSDSLTQVFPGKLAEYAGYLRALSEAGAGIFVTINEANGRSRKAEDIRRVRALFLDLDGAPLEPVTRFELKPHILVESSPRKWHAYWLVDDLPLVDFKPLQRAIAEKFDGDRKVTDLSRVMRLPGFYHRKGNSVMTKLLELDTTRPRYPAHQFLNMFSIHNQSEPHHNASAALSPASSTPSIQQGERNNRLTSIAGKMRRAGMDEARIAEELEKANLRQCNPPLSGDEVQRIVKSVCRYPTGAEQSMNDVGNAQRFVAAHGDELRFNVNYKVWMFSNNGKWEQDTYGRVTELAKQTASRIYNEANALITRKPELATRLKKHADKSHNMSKLKAMISLAQSQPPIPILSDDLDKNIWHLGVNNGVIDLKSGRLLAMTPNLLISKQSPVTYDVNARCPRFNEFLEKIMQKNANLISFLQRAVGYSLTGDVSEQCLFFLHGGGANGKSTLVNVIYELLGDYAGTAPSTMLLSKPPGNGAGNDIASLVGARFAVSSEVRDGARYDERLLTHLTGNDKISVRKLYSDYFEFTPKFKLWIVGNNKPVIKGDVDNTWRRINLIPFVVTIPKSERNPKLPELLRAELPGILNWAIEGCRVWQKDGLNPPPEVIAAVEEYRIEMDDVEQWINDRCSVGIGKKMMAKMAYQDYRGWATTNGLNPMTQNAFGRKLTSRGLEKKHTNNGPFYHGIEVNHADTLATLRAIVA